MSSSTHQRRCVFLFLGDLLISVSGSCMRPWLKPTPVPLFRARSRTRDCTEGCRPMIRGALGCSFDVPVLTHDCIFFGRTTDAPVDERVIR